MKKNSITFFVTIMFCIVFDCFSQKELSLQDAVLKRWTSLSPDKLHDLKWNNEQDFFSYKKSDSCIYILDCFNQLKDSILLSDINSSLNGEEKLISVPNIDWVSAHSFRFRANNKYYIHNINRGNKSIPFFDIKESSSNISFNKQNNKYAYTIDNNLFISTAFGEHVEITNEQNKDIVFGQAVHRYEFGIYKGIFWANNGDKIAFYRKDESMVTDYPLLNIDSRVGYADVIKYPMSGMQSHHVSLGIFNIKNGEIIYLQTGEPKEQYLTNISWGPNDEYIYIAVLNRDQNHLKFNKYRVEDGSFVQTLFEETSDKYVQPLHPMEFISDNQFLWRSERDGYDTFFLYDVKGNLIKKVFNKDYVVKDFYGYSDDNIYFSTYTKDGLGVDLWNVSINKKYQKKIINDGNYHMFKISPSRSYFIDQFSNIEIPNNIRVINYKGNLVANLLNSPNPLKEYNIGSVELLKIKTADKFSLNARLIKPYNFDKNIKYPVLIYVYNGPGVQLIRNNWLASSPLWMYYLANTGYIIFTIDGRGSENRGRDFEQAIFGELGSVEMLDQIEGYNYLLKQKFIDRDRIAIHGWSYGGFMTTNLLLNYPNYFTCGVAGGPVTNWSYYEIMYTERYMDHPDENKQGYEKTNLINKVNLLQDPLLMIHGLVDDVVVPQHSLDFVKKSVDNNIQMDYFIYPGHPHNVRGKDRLHLIKKIINYISLHNN